MKQLLAADPVCACAQGVTFEQVQIEVEESFKDVYDEVSPPVALLGKLSSFFSIKGQSCTWSSSAPPFGTSQGRILALKMQHCKQKALASIGRCWHDCLMLRRFFAGLCPML